MKIFWLSLCLFIAIISAANAGDIRSSPPCDELLAFCKGLFPKEQRLCQTLYNTAVKNGGRWGVVDPRTGQIQGDTLLFCMP
jgi:hypothetical protein